MAEQEPVDPQTTRAQQVDAGGRVGVFRKAGHGIARFGKAIWNGRADSPEQSVIAAGDEPPPLEYGKVDHWYQTFTRWLSYLAAVALGIITLVCFIDVIGWKFFGWTLPSATDLIKFLNLALVFLAAAYVQMDRGSVAIELLQSKFHRVLRLGVRIVSSILGVGVCFFAAYRGWEQLSDLYTRHVMADGVWHFRVWPFQAVLVFGFVCLGLAFLLTIARDITDFKKRRGHYAVASGNAATPTSG